MELSQARISEGRAQSSTVVPQNVPVDVFSQLFAGDIDVPVGQLLTDEVVDGLEQHCHRARPWPTGNV